MQPKLTMTETPEPHVRDAIVGPLIEFNNSQASQPEDYRALAIILSNPDTGGIFRRLVGRNELRLLTRGTSCSFLKHLEAPDSVDKCCFRQSKKRSPVAAEALG